MLSNIFNWIKTGGLPLLFLLVLVEGNPIIGSFVPGQVLVIFVGFLISTAKIYNLYATITIVFIGAFIGDLLGFYLGKKYGISGLKLVGLDNTTSTYKSSYNFFKKYGPWSLVLGREFNFTRAFMPFFAGCFGMSYFTFIIYALASCFIWTVLSIALGYYFGFIIIDNFKFIMEFVLFLLLYIFLVGFVYKNIKNVYYENFNVVKKYALHNLISLGILVVIIISTGYLIKWGYSDFVNDQLWFLYFSGLYLVFGFLTSKTFLLLLALSIFIILFIKNKFRMLNVYLWSIIFFFFMTLIIAIFMKIWYGAKLNYMIILLTFLIFFVWVLIKLFIKNKKKQIILSWIAVIVIIVAMLSEFSAKENMISIITSFLIGVVESELILILSHYRILDSCLSESRFHKF